MGIPSRPAMQHQGPATNCTVVHSGHTYYLGWLSCTCYAGAMGIDKSTLGHKRPSGCAVRAFTGDVSGGTTLEQVRAYCDAIHLVTELHTGNNIATTYYLAFQLQLGRGAVVQGDAGAMVGTPYRSTGGKVNHAIWVNETRGGTTGHPKEALVYDPAADGRTTSWGHAAKGPQWWPWALVVKFAGSLRPANTDWTLGSGKAYCLIFPDTEPHVHLYGGARRTSPFPDKTTVKSPVSGQKAVFRKGPSKDYAYASPSTQPNGYVFVAYQYKPDGGLDHGTRGWYGNHDANVWTHESNLTGKGGTS